MDKEEGAATISRPLLDKENSTATNGECSHGGDHGGLLPSESTTTTLTLVFSTLCAVCGSYAFGNALGYSSPAESAIMKELGLTMAEYSVFGSILSIGAMLGALLTGKLADFIGRRGAMGFSEILCIIGWLVTAFAKNAWWLDLGRFLVGCGIGLLSYVVPVYIAEITPKNIRGSFTSLNQLMIGCGQALAFLIGSLVSWRNLALIGIVPSLVQLISLFFIPESPRWLAKIGRTKEFEASLQLLRGRNANIYEEATDIRDYIESVSHIPERGFLDLFQRKYTYPVTVGVGLMMFQQFGGLNGFAFYTSAIFTSAGFPSNVGVVAAAVAKILMTVVGVIFIDKSGRRPLLLISVAGMCLGCIITGVAFLFKDLDFGMKLVPSLVLIGVVVFLGVFDVGMGGIPWIIMSEIFPINIKGSAGSLVNFVSWSGSWVVSYTFNFFFLWSSAGTFFVYAGICAAGVIFVVTMLPETKGRTLEEIHASVIRNSGSEYKI